MYQRRTPGVLFFRAQEPSTERVSLERVALQVVGDIFEPLYLSAEEKSSEITAHCRVVDKTLGLSQDDAKMREAEYGRWSVVGSAFGRC